MALFVLQPSCGEASHADLDAACANLVQCGGDQRPEALDECKTVFADLYSRCDGDPRCPSFQQCMNDCLARTRCDQLGSDPLRYCADDHGPGSRCEVLLDG